MLIKTLLMTVLMTLLTVTLMGPVSAQDAAPTFSAPTKITNTLAPFTPGSVKVFRGRAGKARTAVLETHLAETRTFLYDGQLVETRIVEEKQFERGALVEVSFFYLAQDDAGNVRLFGEVSLNWDDDDDDGDDDDGPEGEDDNWLVGEALPSDPPGAFEATEPAMYMPADPKVGESFQRQPLELGDETITVMADGLKLRVGAGKFSNVVRFKEADPADGPQSFWSVRGIGMIRESAKGSYEQLMATSLQEAPADGGL